MNKLLRIRTLTDKFFDGITTSEEEQELYDFYRKDDIPDDLRHNRELFMDLAALNTLTPNARQIVPHRHRSWWIAAAVIAMLIIGSAAIYRYQLDNECVAYIYGKRVTDRKVVLGEMQRTMTAMTADGSDVVEVELKAMFGNE